MDEVDRKMLFYLFRDGRMSQRRIASLLGLTPPTVLYRLKKIMDEDILQGFALFINPNFYNNYFSFVAFKNYYDMSKDWIFLKFKCIEWLNVYGIRGRTVNEIEDRISLMTKTLGEPAMVYKPNQQPIAPKLIDIKIINQLIKDPRKNSGDVARDTGINSKVVIKRLRLLKKRGYFVTFPRVNIPKSGIVMFSIFSKKVKEVGKILENCKVIEISDNEAGINICLVGSMDEAKDYVKISRNIDKDADVMIIYDYEINTPYIDLEEGSF
ncbi:winged helix-turn-helix transcriptional regulator [Acidianus sp. RZ1]|uniref:winged helix-turn-helix transcriptional regulator n=1 Tax=Acidianus sp. RZ1 TaxID=1540082 RepID=UPI001490ADD0|nr:winged helix-turn-helix transcriptional regulator [Acidianus sp. RZ1]NON63065.1 winged helix-turn-helix transcriptional regulator [Acidianus sp. RZ1]